MMFHILHELWWFIVGLLLTGVMVIADAVDCFCEDWEQGRWQAIRRHGPALALWLLIVFWIGVTFAVLRQSPVLACIIVGCPILVHIITSTRKDPQHDNG